MTIKKPLVYTKQRNSFHTMNLHSIVDPDNQGDFPPTNIIDSSHVIVKSGSIAARRSARNRVRLSATTADRRLSRVPSIEANVTAKPRGGREKKKRWSPQSSGSGRQAVPVAALGQDRRLNSRTRHRAIGDTIRAKTRPSTLPASPHSATKETLKRAKAAADLCSVSLGHEVSVMDVILESTAPRTQQLDVEAFMDAMEERARIFLDYPSDDEILLEMVSTRQYGNRQAARWQGVSVTPVDCSSRNIYHVSAERSTLT